MKKLAILILVILSLYPAAAAQDTVRIGDGQIYMTPPVIKDSFDYILPMNHSIVFGPARNISLLGDIYSVNCPTHIYGIAVAMKDISYNIFPNERYNGWENGDKDSAYMVFLQVKNSINNTYYTVGDTLIWHSHGASRFLEVGEGVYVPMYELYYNNPLPLIVEDTFGVFFRPTYGWELYPSQLTRYGNDSVISYTDMNTLMIHPGSDTPSYDTRVYISVYGDMEYYISDPEQFGSIYPILVPPDTDAVPQCMAPANLRMTGQRLGYPFLAWDTTEGGQKEYELQYAPYYSDEWITRKPTENPEQVYYPFDPNTYYKARIRSRCHHGCVVHNIWSWSPWSEPILFYTGSTPPDTTTGIDPVEMDAEALFTLTPNPAKSHVTVTIGEAAHSSALAGTSPLHTPSPLRGTPPNLGGEYGEELITVRDAAGHEVLRQAVPAGQKSVVLDLSEQPAGAYFVTLTAAGRSATQRLVVN